MSTTMPRVSVIVPCFNEERTIGLLLDALYNQSFSKNQMEVVIADGMSTDNTLRVIREWQDEHPDLTVKIVENKARNIPSGLNRAINESRGEILIRMDAHAIPAKDYIAKCVELLNQGKADNIGGRWVIEPGGDTWVAKSIAAAASHPLGVGDARYRIGGEPQFVDTVPFGAFKKELIHQIGMYDTNLLTNEDYEFNTRIREAGGKVWFDPSIQSKYIARSTWKDLARQYWRYGYWKVKMLERYPQSIRWRQALPPLLVLGLVVTLALSFVVPAIIYKFISLFASYLIVLFIIGTIAAIKQRKLFLILGLPVSIMIMHLTWGTAFLVSVLQSVAVRILPFRKRVNEQPE